jgi:alkyl hydroperoxide reductase subunit F
MYDLAIIGGGPGGVAAGVYASRKRLKTVIVTETWGGQSTVSSGIQNWIGTIEISGDDFAKALKTHLEAYKDESLDIKEGIRVNNIEKKGSSFLITTTDGEVEAKTVLITTGSSRRKLNVPGADKFENKGITYCASCDGPLFGDMDVVVIGGGNAAFESAAQLLAYTKSVTLLQRGEEYRADPVTVKKVLSNPKMKGVTNTEILEVTGDKFVTGVVYMDRTTKEKVTVPASGVFVEIGLIPATSYVKDLVKLNEYNQIIVDPRTQQTSVEGVWAAGDCTDGIYHQNNIAAGDAVKALEDIFVHLHTK